MGQIFIPSDVKSPLTFSDGGFTSTMQGNGFTVNSGFGVSVLSWSGLDLSGGLNSTDYTNGSVINVDQVSGVTTQFNFSAQNVAPPANPVSARFIVSLGGVSYCVPLIPL